MPEAFTFIRTPMLSVDCGGVSVQDDCSRTRLLARRASSFVECDNSGMLIGLEEGIHNLRNANGYLSWDLPTRVTCPSDLGISLLCRVERLGNVPDVNEDVTSQQAVSLIDIPPSTPEWLNNAFQNQFERL